MTTEVKYLIDSDDILAVEVDFSNCHVRSSFPLGKLSRLPQDCPHCKADWISPQTDEERVINAFLFSLGGISAALKGRSFQLKLEVKHEDSAAA